MQDSIRILIVEDLPTDAELAQREIRRTFKLCEFRTVETQESYLAALKAFQPDIIVSDYRMPRFDGLAALKLAQETSPLTPVIILTSAINEDTAVECMKAGAADYVIKEHIKRLGQALLRALEDRHLREQRRRTEEDLRASEERFRSLYENSAVGIYRTTPDGRILMANPAAVRMLGCRSFAELAERNLEKGWFEPAYPRDEFRRKLESEEVITGLESAWLRKDGTIVFVRESARAVRDEQGKIIYYDGTFEDVTERRQAEDALVRLKKAVETSGEIIFMTDPEGTITFINPSFTDVYGYTAAEVVGKTTARILKSGQEEQSRYEAFWMAILAKQTVKGELLNKSKDGRFLHVESSVNPILDDRGNIIGFLAIQRDITERKRIEKALRESEQQNRAIVNAVPDLLFRVSRDGTILDYRAQDEADLYVPPEEFKGRNVKDVLPPRVSVPAMQAVASVLQRNEKVTFEYELEDRNGEVRFFEDRVVALSREEVLSVIRDITDRKRAEQALRESEKNFRLLVESAPDAIFVQTQLRFAYLNPAALKLYGAESVEQMMGQPVMARFHPDFREIARERIRLLNEERKSAPAIQQKHLKLDGTPLDVEVSGVPFVYRGHDGALVFVRDVSERMRAEEERAKLESQLLQAQKMESVGRLAGGVAHDFNNMLSVILGYAELIKARLPLGDPLLIDMLEIERAAGRARDITGQLLAFSRKQIIAPKPLDLNEVISSTEKTLARLIGEDIDLRFYPEEDIWKIKFDASQLDQILINLAVNARDAMPDGGKLTIETAKVEFDQAYCREHLDCAPGQYVMMAVSDDGTGMDKETLSHVFEPFFTTKEVGKGTGLGLATVYGIVKQNGGIINIYSEPGRGTSFKIYIPRIKDTETAEKAQEILEIPGGGNILLVEDDEMVRRMTTGMLKAIGYTVVVAATPLDALALCEKSNERFDLLLTDVVMPEMSGAELKDRIAAIRPGIKVLFMSGYTSNVIVHRGVLDDGVNFIQKPFSRNDLARKIREAVEGR